MSETRYYVGPVDEVTLVLADGRQLDVERGGKIEVERDDAARLDAQNTDEQQMWAKRADAAAVKEARDLPKALTGDEPDEPDEPVDVDHTPPSTTAPSTTDRERI